MQLPAYSFRGLPRRFRNGRGELARFYSQRFVLDGSPKVYAVSLRTRDKSVAMQRAKEYVETKIRTLVLRTDPIARSETLGIHVALEEYKDDIRAKGHSQKQAEQVKNRIKRFIAQAKLTNYGQLDPVIATKTISQLWEQGVFKTTTTANRYRECLRSWSTWMKRNKRWPSDVLEDMAKLEGDPTNSRPRSRLTREQLDLLLKTTKGGPMRRNLFGAERCWMYALATMTGLRASELDSLTPASFHLNEEPPFVQVHPTISKRRKLDRIELRPEFAEAVAEWLQDKPAGEKLWGRSRSWVGRAATMLRADLEAAGIPHKVQTPDGESVIDFHSFRAFFITEAIMTREPSAVVMKTVRASSESILARYTKIGSSDTSRCVNAIGLPKLDTLRS